MRKLTDIHELMHIIHLIQVNDRQSFFAYFSPNGPGFDLDINDMSMLSYGERIVPIIYVACANPEFAIFLIKYKGADVTVKDPHKDASHSVLYTAVTHEHIAPALIDTILMNLRSRIIPVEDNVIALLEDKIRTNPTIGINSIILSKIIVHNNLISTMQHIQKERVQSTHLVMHDMTTQTSSSSSSAAAASDEPTDKELLELLSLLDDVPEVQAQSSAAASSSSSSSAHEHRASSRQAKTLKRTGDSRDTPELGRMSRFSDSVASERSSSAAAGAQLEADSSQEAAAGVMAYGSSAKQYRQGFFAAMASSAESSDSSASKPTPRR